MFIYKQSAEYLSVLLKNNNCCATYYIKCSNNVKVFAKYIEINDTKYVIRKDYYYEKIQ